MTNRRSRETEIAERMKQGKALKVEREDKLRELTDKQTKLKICEAKRDEQHEDCRQMGVDPKNIDAEIDERIKKIDGLIASYQKRYEAILARSEAVTGAER